MIKLDKYITIINECKSRINKLMDKIVSKNLPENVMREELKKIKAKHDQFMQKIQDICSHPDTYVSTFNGIRHIFCHKCLKTISIEKNK